MNTKEHLALIVTLDRDWGASCTRRLADLGCKVRQATSGASAIESLQKQVYDLVVVDDTLSDFDPVEFGLSVREVTPNRPQLFVGLRRLSALDHISEPCNIVYVGPRDRMLHEIPSFLGGNGQSEAVS